MSEILQAAAVRGQKTRDITLFDQPLADPGAWQVLSMVARGRGEFEFRKLLERLPAGAYTCNTDGLITFCNTRAVELWGRKPALHDPVDRFCGSFRLFSANGEAIVHEQCWMARALRENRPFNGEEIVVERPDGRRITVLAHANPIYDDGGQLIGAVNVLIDITDRKQAEQALNASVEQLHEADRRKDDFLAVLAHELRNPLAPLCNGLEVIRTAGVDSAVAVETFAMMERQVGQLMRLVDDLTEVSRITRGMVELQRERVSLAYIINVALDTSQPLIDAARHRLVITLPSEPVILFADPVRLAQVFSNLLSNAANYTPRGGTIELSAETGGNQVTVIVRDNGNGISGELLPSIFELFVRGSTEPGSASAGMGVGLSLVHSLVRMHYGSVAAHSDGIGRGTEFVVALPLAESSPAAKPKGRQPANGPDGPRHRVLAIDDNHDSADSLVILLRLIGADAQVAYDGASALRAVDADLPDLVLLDLSMPGMDGYEVAQRIRERPGASAITLVALTGGGRDEEREHATAVGFDQFLVKPVDVESLKRLLAGLPAGTRH
jgi:PAS domain S-box-containing protein